MAVTLLPNGEKKPGCKLLGVFSHHCHVCNLSEAKGREKSRTVEIKAEKIVGIEVSIFNSIQTIKIFNYKIKIKTLI